MRCRNVWKAAQRMQRVSVAMACVVPLLSRFTCARLRQVLSVSTLCLFSVSVGVQLVCNFVPAQRMQRVSVAMAGVGLSVSARVRMVVYHDGTEYGMHCTVLELDIDK